MEKSLVFMEAFLERFNVVHVYVSKNYYQGIVHQFYLKNITAGTIMPAKIVFDYEDEKTQKHVYQLMINNIRLGDQYKILNNYGLTCSITSRGIVNDPMFDHLYSYLGHDLGANYTVENTVFKVWSPTSHSVKLQYTLKTETKIVEMIRDICGVYTVTIKGDLEGAKYGYLVSNGDHCTFAIDPYAYASSANAQESIVVNKDKFIKSVAAKKPIKQKTDVIIYEVSVRDFTSSNSINSKYRSQFLGVVEKGLTTKQGLPAGFDYLLELGITHVQLMPIFDFASVEETCPSLLYNWGYDPSQFNVPEGSYCSNINDPYNRINECISMINQFHRSGLRVTMDMVVNHVYDVNASSFERLVPHYYFRNDDFGNISDGSYCSNDINSECVMVRKYILDMCQRWQQIYGIDGFRFDLMGILDVETINQVEASMYRYDPNVLIYGEGWNMNTMLPDHKKAMIDNHASMSKISFFNDEYRDTLKGTTFSGSYQELGYLTGNDELGEHAGRVIKNVSKFSSPVQSINYVECHDNATVYDYLKAMDEESEEMRLKRQKLLNCAVILSQGIPLLHCGQEFCRTKQGVSNSYNSPDSINLVDWDLKDQHLDQVDFVRHLIELRQKNEGFRYASKEMIDRYVQIYFLDRRIMVYRIEQQQGEYKEIKVIFNPTEDGTYYTLEVGEQIILTTEETAKHEYASLLIPPVSVFVIAKN